MSACKRCNSPINPGSKFCLNCGAPVEEARQPASEDVIYVADAPKPPKRKKKFGALVATLLILCCFVVVSGLLVYRFLPDGLRTVTREKDARRIEVEVTDGELVLDLEMTRANYGNVVLVEQEDGSFERIPETIWTEEGVRVRLQESCTVIVVDKSVDFSDVANNAWGVEYIDYLSARGYIEPVSGNAFCPGEPMSRKDMARILWKVAGCPEPVQQKFFSDVTDPAYTEAISYMAEAGITAGYADGTFKPDEPVSRQQIVTMLYRFAKANGRSVEYEKEKALADFADGDQVYSWAVEPMEWALNNGVLYGRSDGTLRPKESATRVQVCRMLFFFLQGYAA